MIDTQKVFQNIIDLLDKNKVEYKLFSHRAALTYDDLAAVQKETSFFGTEAKCMVLKTDDRFIVYITVHGKRVNFNRIKETLGAKKIRLATKEELFEFFGAEPGCAYPFGFEQNIPIYIDPSVYEQEWLLFSPLLPTKTVQAKALDLKRVFQNLPNSVKEVRDFNE